MTERIKTAIVFGKGPVAVRATQLLLDESYKILFIVPSPSHNAGDPSFASWASGQGLEVRPAIRLDDLDLPFADLGISAYFDLIFRQRHIDKFGLLANLHNSLLPKHRGVRPINWALKNGDPRHGVTLHQITPGIDEGPILAQEAFAVDPAVDEVRDVYGRCLAAAEILLEKSLPRIWDLVPIPQDGRHASHHSATDDEHLGDRRFWTRSDTQLL